MSSCFHCCVSMRNSTPAKGAEGAGLNAGDAVLDAEGVDEAEDAPLETDIVRAASAIKASRGNALQPTSERDRYNR